MIWLVQIWGKTKTKQKILFCAGDALLKDYQDKACSHSAQADSKSIVNVIPLLLLFIFTEVFFF